MFNTRSWLRRVAAFLVPLFVAAGAHAALPRRHHAGRRPSKASPSTGSPTASRCCCSPTRSKPKTTVNVTYRVGSAHENYGETGMAHLLEHLVFKGTPTRGNIMQELGRRGMSFNGTHELGPHQLLRDVHRVERQPRLGAGDGSRPDGQLVHPPERPRLRDDGGAQRVRERREQSAARAVRQACCRPPYQWHNYGNMHDRRALRHRERRHRPPAGVLQDCTTSRTTPC